MEPGGSGDRVAADGSRVSRGRTRNDGDSGATPTRREATTPAPAVLEATDLRFAHAGRGDPVLQGCNLTIGSGERVILQGPSGGGKSTLASLLAGLRTPQSGLVLLDGLDRHTVGFEGWRRRVVLVPQFHENHLVLGSVAFNLLDGCAVAARRRTTSIARTPCCASLASVRPSIGCRQACCRRSAKQAGSCPMASGAGSTSRARLLQNPDILILDESFAQLDPANMHLALTAVTARPSAVLLIAHP